MTVRFRWSSERGAGEDGGRLWCEEDLLGDEVEGAGVGEIKIGVEEDARYSVERGQMFLLLQYRPILLIIIQSVPQSELETPPSLLHLIPQIRRPPPAQPALAIPSLPLGTDFLEVRVELGGQYASSIGNDEWGSLGTTLGDLLGIGGAGERAGGGEGGGEGGDGGGDVRIRGEGGEGREEGRNRIRVQQNGGDGCSSASVVVVAVCELRWTDGISPALRSPALRSRSKWIAFPD